VAEGLMAKKNRIETISIRDFPFYPQNPQAPSVHEGMAQRLRQVF
jgi:hypothetical protein